VKWVRAPLSIPTPHPLSKTFSQTISEAGFYIGFLEDFCLRRWVKHGEKEN
jgi:hypothetical protein